MGLVIFFMFLKEVLDLDLDKTAFLIKINKNKNTVKQLKHCGILLLQLNITSARQWLITINRIQNKSFGCTYVCALCIFITYI